MKNIILNAVEAGGGGGGGSLNFTGMYHKSLKIMPCFFVVSVQRGFLFLWVLGMGCVILLWHSLSLPYNYFGINFNPQFQKFISF